MLLYAGIAIVVIIAIAAVLLMKKKNAKSEITESTQEFISEASKQSAAESDISGQGGQNESAEEENFSIPVSAEEEKPKDDFNAQ